jgi:hypothetical protein
MPPWLKLSRVRKVQVLGNQQSFFQLASSPDPFVRTTYQSLIDIEKELHETLEQRRTDVVDVLSSADAVPVFRPEEDVAEVLWMGSAELNKAALSRKKTLFRRRMFCGNRVEVLNQQPDCFAAQLRKSRHRARTTRQRQ